MASQGRALVLAPQQDGEHLTAILTSLGFDVCAAAADGAAGLAAAAESQPELALVDVEAQGSLPAATAMAQDLDIYVVFVGDPGNAESLRQAEAAGPLGYVLKPVDERQLALTLSVAMAARRRMGDSAAASRFPPARMLETVFQSVNEGVLLMDGEGNIRYANRATRRMFGTPTDDFTPTAVLQGTQVLRPDRVTPVPAQERPLFRALGQGESTTNFEAYVITPDGSEGRYLSIDAKPLLDGEGNRNGCLLVFRDIGQHKAAETELLETAARLAAQTQTMDTVFDGIADGVGLMDREGNVLRVNRAALDILTPELVQDVPGYPQSDLDVFYADRVTPVAVEDLPHVRALRGEPCDQMRFFVVHPSMPEGILLSVSARVVQGEPDDPARTVILFRDITTDYQQEQALLQAFAQGRMEAIDTMLHNVGNAVNSVATGIGTLRERLSSRNLLRRLTAVAEALDLHDADWIAYLRDDPQGTQVLPFVRALDKDLARENAALERTAARVEERVRHIVEILRTQHSVDSSSSGRKTVALKTTIAAGLRILEESLKGPRHRHRGRLQPSPRGSRRAGKQVSPNAGEPGPQLH